jgi:hypothetical protein
MAAAGGHWIKRKGKARFVAKKSKRSTSSATTKRSVRVQSENGSHYVVVDGQRWARFDRLDHAHAAAQGI